MAVLKAFVLSVLSVLLAVFPASTYTEGVVAQPKSFFPSTARSLHEQTISTLIYRSLFKYDIYGVLIPDLADTWGVAADGITYTITLKNNQYWSNGQKITADDLIYTSYKVPDLAGVATDKVDDLTVRYTLPNKYSPFLSLLTVGVMHQNSEEKENPLAPVSSGEWRIGNTQTVGKVIKQITLITQNSNYTFKKIRFKYYPNEEEVVTAAKLGEIDGFTASKTEELQNFTDYPFPSQGIYYALYFNLRGEKFKDLALRQKLEKVLPIKELIADRGIIVEGPVSRSVFTDRNINFYKFDPKFNEELNDINLTLTVSDTPQQVDLAEKIKQIWKDRLSVNVELNKVPQKDILTQVITPRNFEILLYGQEVGRDPDRYVNWHSTQKDAPGLNVSGFEHVRADRALEEGRKEQDNDKRLIHYHEFQKAVNENVPAIFLYHPFTHYYVSKFIEGIGDKYTFTQADRFLDFINWKRLATN